MFQPPMSTPAYVSGQFAPASTVESLVEIGTNVSSCTRLRIVHGARTRKNAATAPSAAGPLRARQASGSASSGRSSSASARVSAASAIAAPALAADLTVTLEVPTLSTAAYHRPYVATSPSSTSVAAPSGTPRKRWASCESPPSRATTETASG